MLDFVPEKRATAAEVLKHPWLDGSSTRDRVRKRYVLSSVCERKSACVPEKRATAEMLV